MASALPRRPDIDHTPTSRTVLDLSGDDAAAVLEAIGSETARKLLRSLDDGPKAASDLAGAVDTSLQNVQYHLERLERAGVVTVVGTWYSAKGREMRVYALASERLEVCLGGEPRRREPAVTSDV